MSDRTYDIPHSHFNLTHLDEHERYDAWRDSIACVFTVEAAPDIRNRGFHAEVEAWQLTDLMLVRTETLQQQWNRGVTEIARDGMDHYMIQLFVAGSTVIGNNQHTANDYLIVFDLSREASTFTSSFNNLSLILPRRMLEPLLNWPDHQHLRTLPLSDPLAAMLRDHIISLHNQLGKLTLTAAGQLNPATLNLIAACLNGSMHDLPMSNELESVSEVRRVRRYIAENIYNPDLSPTMICLALGLSRSKLYRIFSARDGIAGYIKECRLQAAFQLLTKPANSSKKLYEIAQACGFRSSADFSRSFRRRYGISPKEARANEKSLLLTTTNDSPTDRRYEKWLTMLGS